MRMKQEVRVCARHILCVFTCIALSNPPSILWGGVGQHFPILPWRNGGTRIHGRVGFKPKWCDFRAWGPCCTSWYIIRAQPIGIWCCQCAQFCKMPFLSVKRFLESEKTGGIRKRKGEWREANRQVQDKPVASLELGCESYVVVSAPRSMITYFCLLV